MGSQTQRPTFLKKILIGTTLLLVLFFTFLLTVPFWFNIDKYRPDIVSIASQHLNGKLSLGKLSLSFWGQFKIKVDSLEIQDSTGEPFIRANSLFAEVPLSSVFSKAPSLSLKLDKPEIQILRDKTGQMNAMTLIKASEEGSSELSKKSAKDREKGEGTEVDRWLQQSQLNLDIKKALLVYRDLTTGNRAEIKDLNVEMKQFSLNRPGDMKISANIDTTFGQSFRLKGPFELIARVNFKPHQESGVTGQMEVSSNLKPIELSVGEGFKKFAGQNGNFLLSLEKTATAIEIRKFELILADSKIAGTAVLKDVFEAQGANAILEANLKGELPGFELEARTRLNSLTQPRGEMLVISPGIDLDKMFPQPEKTKEVSQTPKTSFSKTTQGPESSSLDTLMESLKENPYFKNSTFTLKGDLKKVKSKGVVVSDILVSSSFKSGIIALDSFKMKLLGGEGSGSGLLNLTGRIPSYRVSADLKALQLDQAMASQSDLLKNLLKGKAQFSIQGTGESLDPEKAKVRFNGKGTLTVTEARFTSLNIGQMATQALGNALSKIVEQIPVLKGKQLSSAGPIDSQYELISSDFTIQKGVFESPNFIAKAVAQKGIDLKGRSQVDLKTCELRASWQIIDTYNITKARDLSVEQNGVKIEHVLARGNEPVVFPVEVGGFCSAPQVDYGAVSGALAQVALENIAKGAVKKVTQDVTKKLEDEIKKQAGKPLQDALKGLFRK